jgi:glycerol-3-phosphate O-acyltransferase
MADPPRPAPHEPDWPAETADRRVVFLLDAASALEERLLREWIERRRPEGAPPAEAVAIPSSRRRRRRRVDGRLEPLLATGDDPLLAPLRVIWRARQRRGEEEREVGASDLLRLGDPRDPSRLREHYALRAHPDRVWIVAGEPAPASELRVRWRDAGGADVAQTLGLRDFVVRQAHLALERAERQVRGARYKVPRFVHEDILARPAFRGGLAALASQLGRPEKRVLREAGKYLREIAATHDTFVIDLVVQLWRALYTRGYGALRYEHAAFDQLRSLAQRNPVVFLPSHKSNLDHAVLQYALHENGLPPNHTAGGINMNFFPIGPLVRRSGVFFIRRTFKDNEVYKFVLRHYIDYLVEKRFPLEWYVEGGRSRSGKLLAPRFGLLAYVVDAYRRGKSDDVLLQPVSIAYDQISDVGDYAAEQRGSAKEREGFGWFLRVVRRLGRQYGDVHLRFAEPISLAKAVGPADPSAEPRPDDESLALQKLAFEVCFRINQATPITPTSLVTLALLGRGDRALSLAELVEALRNLLAYVRRRRLPTTEELDLDTPEGVRRALDPLVGNGILACYDEGPEPVWMIAPDQHLAAAYYRNTVIHFFVNGAIVELALIRAAEDGVEDSRREFWEEAARLRDLLKFEFFFADKEVWRNELRQELAPHDPDWESRLEVGPHAIEDFLPDLRPFHAHRILRPFLEAYRVVADELARRDPKEPVEDGPFLKSCLALGRQYVLQHHVRSAESVSQVLFGNALRLARNRGLLGTDEEALREARRRFSAEIREAIRRVDAVEALAQARRAGLID